MNIPTIIGALIILGIVVLIVARAIYNKKHHRSGCSCGGCSGCSTQGICHPKAPK